MRETANQRSNIYALMARIYRKEVTPDFLQHLKDPRIQGVLSDLDVKLESDFLERDEEELIEDLAVDYTQLFIGPKEFIPPHESVHHERDDGDWGTLWGADTIAVKKFIESAGLEYMPEHESIPDHISTEFEFMHRVISREEEAWREGDNEGALYCLRMEKMFLDDHLLKWVPVFCDKVIDKADLSFYREMAKLTKSFLIFEKDNISNYIAPA